jgi:alkylated DNA repair dioxygenase AlkB
LIIYLYNYIEDMEDSPLHIIPCKPNGLYYIRDIINKCDEATIIESLDRCQWRALSNSANSRVVQHYGYLYDYKTKNIRIPCDPLPDFLEILRYNLTHICNEMHLIQSGNYFNQCIVNNYNNSQGISTHTDFRGYGNIIGCFTLNAGAIMIFKKSGESDVELYTEPLSLYIMSKDSRLVWTHEMPSRSSDCVQGTSIPRDRRISVTFRHVPN